VRTNPETTCIYGLFDPRTGECFYVGKANNPSKRFAEHLSCTKNAKKYRWIQSIVDAGYQPELRTLEVLPYAEWEASEIRWIYQMTREGHPLTNQTPGGVFWSSVTIDEAHDAFENLAIWRQRFADAVANEYTIPLDPQMTEFRKATFDAIEAITRELLGRDEVGTRIKSAAVLAGFTKRLEGRWQRLQR